MRSSLGSLALLLALGGTAVNAGAATVVFTNTQSNETGTGFGTIANLLVLQAPGNGSSEWGSVGWDGSGIVRTDHATAQSSVQSAAFMQANNFGSAFS